MIWPPCKGAKYIHWVLPGARYNLEWRVDKCGTHLYVVWTELGRSGCRTDMEGGFHERNRFEQPEVYSWKWFSHQQGQDR